MSLWKSDDSNIGEQKAWILLPHHRHTNSATINRQIPFVRNQKLMEKLVHFRRTHRLNATGGEIWSFLSPDILLPGQCHTIRKKLKSASFTQRERRGWFIHSEPIFSKGYVKRLTLCLTSLGVLMDVAQARREAAGWAGPFYSAYSRQNETLGGNIDW